MKSKLNLTNGKMAIGVGFDRLDYTKGIPDRFKAVDRFSLAILTTANTSSLFRLVSPAVPISRLTVI